MIVAVIALICALTGTAWAALGKNSVGTKQLKKNAVTTAKIKKEAVTGGKVKKDTLTGTQINEGTLGAVPLANTVPANPLHVVGAAGEPAFQGGTHNLGSSLGISLPGASFVKDHDNIVQLEGIIEIPVASPIPVAYQLPPGFRPPAGQLVVMEQNETTVIIAGSNTILEGVDISGDVLTSAEEPAILTGFSFVAGS
jgi:hypothetical protein